MSEETATTVKKITRARRTVVKSDSPVVSTSVSSGTFTALDDVFESLIRQITESREELQSLQKTIEETKMSWVREQREHELLIAQQRQQEEVARKRELETYEYETAKRRREQEDAFEQKRLSWERELQLKKDELASEKKELEMLRKQVAGFEDEKEKAIKGATAELEKTLTVSFTTEKKLREQEVKAEKELLGLKIANLSSENTRLKQEIEEFKKALEDATRQLKDVAVRVIDSANSQARQQVAVPQTQS